MTLSHTSTERIKFSDVDSMGIMWHGHYIRLFEEGREQFGLTYQLDYLTVFDHGYFTPIIKTEIKHLAPLDYGDTAVIEAIYIFKKAAKIEFEYKIYSQKTGKLVCTGKTTQVFLDSKRELVITNPPFYEAWKIKHFGDA